MKSKVRTWFVVTVVLCAVVTVLSLPAFSADEGAATFKAKCAMCHGADGTGNTAMGKTLKIRDLTSPEVQKQSDAEILAVITKGKNKMPEYGSKLSKEQVADLEKYIRSIAKK